jgi:hypothetical protein
VIELTEITVEAAAFQLRLSHPDETKIELMHRILPAANDEVGRLGRSARRQGRIHHRFTRVTVQSPQRRRRESIGHAYVSPLLRDNCQVSGCG